ncbi:MAG: LytTR family DNA-binding domain-containing protein [Bacillota bacterium]|nr:LytTR family DNA-binding domain-containing protein [Bacillota bacterium]
MNVAIFENNMQDQERLIENIRLLEKRTMIKCTIIIIKNEEQLFSIINDINILFLDIELGDVNGISLGKKIKNINVDCKVIIVSAYQKYLIDGYKIKAERYFVKPINTKEFLVEMKDVIQEYYYRELGFVDEKISRDKIVIHNIVYIEFVNRHTVLHCINNKEYETSYPLKYWLEKLCEYNFVQCYKSIVVNLEHLKQIKKIDLLLTNEQIIPISRFYKKEVEEKYYRYLAKKI